MRFYGEVYCIKWYLGNEVIEVYWKECRFFGGWYYFSGSLKSVCSINCE